MIEDFNKFMGGGGGGVRATHSLGFSSREEAQNAKVKQEEDKNEF